MPTILPKDDDNNPIPALRLKDGAAHKIIATTEVARNITAFNYNTKVVSVYATDDIYLDFGTSDVTTSYSSHFFPAGVYYDFAINNAKQAKDTHIAVMQAGSNSSIVYISEKE